MIYISSNNVRHPVTKTFTTLHPTTLHSTSLHLSTLHFLSFKHYPTTLHYPLIWLKPNLNFQPLHFNSHHYNSLTTSYASAKCMIPTPSFKSTSSVVSDKQLFAMFLNCVSG